MDRKHIETKNKLGGGFNFKISRFKEKIKKTYPHKHDDYYELILLKEGEGFHWIESNQYFITAPEFYILNPGQLHHWQFTSRPVGFVILFRNTFFDSVKEFDTLNLYKQLSRNVRCQIPPERYPENLLNDILDEFYYSEQYSSVIINGLLKALFGRLLNIAKNINENSIIPDSIYDKFQQLLSKEINKYHKVNNYANILCTTPQNLNTICKKQTGKTASEIINHQIILEAKRYILHTENTINEISHLLNFSDVSNFVKFFKRIEGVTPIQFKQRYFQ